MALRILRSSPRATSVPAPLMSEPPILLQARHPGRTPPRQSCRKCPAERCHLRPAVLLCPLPRTRGLAPGHRATRRAPQARRRRSGGSSRQAPAGECSGEICARSASSRWGCAGRTMRRLPPPLSAVVRRGDTLSEQQASTATQNPTPRRPPWRPPALASPPAKRPRVAGWT